MTTHIPLAPRQAVVERAGERCEYCLYPQSASYLAFQIEHIIAEKHGGATLLENLAPVDIVLQPTHPSLGRTF